MRDIAKHEHLEDAEHRRCRHCHQVIVLVPDVGWVDPIATDSYDICPDEPMGNHDPE